MRTLMFSVLIVVTGAYSVPARETASDLDRMQGIWQVVSLTEKGKAVPMKDIESLEVVILKDDFTVSEKGVVIVHYGIKLDAAKKPKAIDYTPRGEAKKEDKGKVITELGIYAFENDQLKLVGTEDGLKRPASFEAKDTDACSVMVLKRKKS